MLCIGGRASGSDLAREISEFANKVYLSDTTCVLGEGAKVQTAGNVSWVPKTVRVGEEGEIHFDGGGGLVPPLENVDVIIFCTGYDYGFSFVNDDSNLELRVVKGEKRITPLYEQLWHAHHPHIAFVGIPHSVVPFSFFEIQAEAIAARLVDDGPGVELPRLEERVAAARVDAEGGGPKEGGRVVDTHFLGGWQWEWVKKYALYAGVCDEEFERFVGTQKVS